MIESLIYLLVIVVLFIGAAWGALWVINNFFDAPWHTPVKLVVGLILLIVLLLVVAQYFGGNLGARFPTVR
jgi:hypothetical protein